MSTKSKVSPIEVKAMRLPNGLGLPFPEYQSEEAAGLDLVAAVPITAPVRLLPGTRQLIPTGLTLEIPAGYEGQVRPRSGLAVNHGVTVLNSPGTIDSDYRGEIMVLLVNLGRETFVVTRGQRIAQLVVQPVARAEIVDVRAVAASKRASNGFGSTGLDTGAAEAERDDTPAAAQAPVAASAVKEAAKSAPVKLVQPPKEVAKAKKADPKPPAKTVEKVTAKETPKATVKAAPKLAAKAMAKPPSKTKRVDKPAPKKAAGAKPAPASKSKAGARA